MRDVLTGERGQMSKTAITLAVLLSAASFAYSPTFAESGRRGGNGVTAKPTATASPVATPKIDKSSSNLLKNSATGKHYQKSQ